MEDIKMRKEMNITKKAVKVMISLAALGTIGGSCFAAMPETELELSTETTDEENHLTLTNMIRNQISRYSFSAEQIDKMTEEISNQVIEEYLDWVKSEAAAYLNGFEGIEGASDMENYEALKSNIRDQISRYSFSADQIEDLTNSISAKIIEDYLAWSKTIQEKIGQISNNSLSIEKEVVEEDSESPKSDDEENYETLLETVRAQLEQYSISVDGYRLSQNDIEDLTEQIIIQVIEDFQEWADAEAKYTGGFKGIENASDEKNYEELKKAVKDQISRYSFSADQIDELTDMICDKIIEDYLNWQETEAEKVGWSVE